MPKVEVRQGVQDHQGERRQVHEGLHLLRRAAHEPDEVRDAGIRRPCRPPIHDHRGTQPIRAPEARPPLVEVERLSKATARSARCATSRSTFRSGEVHAHLRPQRRRQEHARQEPRRPPRPDRARSARRRGGSSARTRTRRRRTASRSSTRSSAWCPTSPSRRTSSSAASTCRSLLPATLPCTERARDAARPASGSRTSQLAPPVETALDRRAPARRDRPAARPRRAVLILDEPTATLSEPEIERVFAAVRELVVAGTSVIFVSHRLDEVFELCDRVTVFRDGERLVAPSTSTSIDRRELIRTDARRDGASQTTRALHADRASRRAGHRRRSAASRPRPRGRLLARRSAAARSSAWPGRSAPARARSCGRSPGSSPAPAASPRSTAARDRLRHARGAPLDAGVVFVSNDRQGEGLFLRKTVEQNLRVTRLRQLSRLGAPAPAPLAANARASSRRSRRHRPRAAVGARRDLSGGNQQKVLLGRALRRPGTVLLALDEPTRGVDVGGRAEIHGLIREAARRASRWSSPRPSSTRSSTSRTSW